MRHLLIAFAIYLDTVLVRWKARRAPLGSMTAYAAVERELSRHAARSIGE